jgi:alkylation response protein AidB-like acyl-CoA dehydrogenase
MQLTRDTLLDEECRMLTQTVSEFREQVLTEKARDLDEEASSGVVEEVFKHSAALGLTGALSCEASGGQGMDSFAFCLALEEVAQGSAGLAAVLLSHNAALMLLEKAGAPVEASMLEGDGRAALAWPASFEGGTVRADYVPGGTGASLLVAVDEKADVYSASGDAAAVEEITRPMGWRAARPAGITFDLGAPVGSVGAEGLKQLECRILSGLSAIALGISRHAFGAARAYAEERWQGCDYIINHQQMRLMLGGMLVGIESGEAALKQLAWCVDEGNGTTGAHRALKVFACDDAIQAALDGVQIHGGYGYMRDYGMEVLMRDAKACQVYPRTPAEEMLDLLE